jgi:hypothetical protein
MIFASKGLLTKLSSTRYLCRWANKGRTEMATETAVVRVGQLPGRVCELRHRRTHERLDGLGLYKGQSSMLRALWAKDGMTQAAEMDPGSRLLSWRKR